MSRCVYTTLHATAIHAANSRWEVIGLEGKKSERVKFSGGFGAWGRNTGPIAAILALFVHLKFSNLVTFILGGQFLLPQKANNEKREILLTPEMG